MIIVKICMDCPHLTIMRTCNFTPAIQGVYKKVKDPYEGSKIPKWCPLPDAPDDGLDYLRKAKKEER